MTDSNARTSRFADADESRFTDADESRFTDWLRERSEPDWTAATTHRFTDELGDGTLDRTVFARYLVQDYAFVTSLVGLVGDAVSAAPTMAQKARLVAFLATITDGEDDYFERSFEALGVDAETYLQPSLTEPTAAMHDLFRAAGREGYAETLAVLLPVEWVYRAWADRVDAPDEPFYYREWVTIHDVPSFDAFVDWVRDELDAVGPTLTPYREARVVSLFERAVALEVRFFDAAFDLDTRSGLS